jgi:hypothetical protein
VGSGEGNILRGLNSETSPTEPKIEIEASRRSGQCTHNLAANRNGMRSNFTPERFTQDNDVLCMFPVLRVSRREPQIQSIKEMDPRAFNGIAVTEWHAEVDRAAEDPPKCVDHTSIVRAIDG